MTHYHVFNGDADGLCAMVQLYRSAPMPDAVIVTGRKRDINLLGRVDAGAGDVVTVLDISMRSNSDDLRRLLKTGAQVFYVDHHNAGDIPDHDNLSAIIDTSSQMCTAVLVDDILQARYRAWAVTGAFGDNFPALAKARGAGMDWPLDRLQRLGILLNYNGYGASLEDLHFHPEQLYLAMRGYDSPMEFLAARPEIFTVLDTGYTADMATARAGEVRDKSDKGLIVRLADNAASRRASGGYGNALAQENPRRAHAVLTHNDGGYVVSVRAPLANRTGADTLCLQFNTGGGRAAAAGINHLPHEDLDRFAAAFRAAFT